MKKLVLFSLSLAFLATVILTACQKEQLVKSEIQTTQTSNLSLTKAIPDNIIKTDKFASWPFPPPICMYFGTAIAGHCELPSGFCHYDWFDFNRPADLNEAPGYGSVNAENVLRFDFNITDVDPAYLSCITEDHVLKVAQNYQIPDDILQSIYDNAGLPKPEGAFVVPAGDYPVQMMYGGDGPCWEDHLIAYYSDWEYSPILGWYPTNVSYFHIRVPCSGGSAS